MLHIMGSRLFFSDIGAIGFSASEVVEQCKQYLDDLAKTDRIEEFDTAGLDSSGRVICFDREISHQDTDEFKAILVRFKELVGLVKERRLPDHGRALLALLKTNPTLYLQLLCPTNVRKADFCDVPVLATVPVTEFVDEFLSLSRDAQDTALTTFVARYAGGLLNSQLRSEKDWLQGVRDELYAKSAGMPPLSRFRLRHEIKSVIDRVLEIDLAPSAERA
jgi:hypothetical protein